MSPALLHVHRVMSRADAATPISTEDFDMALGNTNAHAVAARPASYGHGTILASAADEARKSTQGRRMIRERVMALGKHSIYNLTGLVRTFPVQPQDLEPLENQFTYY